MRLALLTVIAALLVSTSPASARSPVMAENFPDQPVGTASGAKPTLDQVREAIVKAAASKDWALAKQANDRFVATRVIRGKHTIVSTISFSAEKFSVTYQSSENMKAEVLNGHQFIHPNYNVWARELVDAIRIEISKI
jgi:hypothetical protein